MSKCAWCNEPLFGHERNPMTPYLEMHRECGFRSTIGSFAHLRGTCGCYVAGSEEGDPPWLSRRAAARLAFEYWIGLTDEEREAAIARPKIKGEKTAMEEKAEKVPMRMMDLPIMAEFDEALARITDEDVIRIGNRLADSEVGDAPLGAIHSEEARKLWALALHFEKAAVMQAVKGKFDAGTKEELEQLAETGAQYASMEECTRNLFWLIVKTDIGGKAWRSNQISVRSGWMLVATGAKRPSLKKMLGALGLPMPPEEDEEQS